MNWIQNSVFEGEITEAQLKELKMSAKAMMEVDCDSLIIFRSENERWLMKEVVGKEKVNFDDFL